MSDESQTYFVVSGKTPGPVNRSIHHYVKLSFKEGLENNFLQIINDTIQNKKWEIYSPTASLSQVEHERKDVFCAGTFVTSKEV